MNTIFHLLIAALLIAGMILLRMFVERRVLQARNRSNFTDGKCEQTGCFRGCDADQHGVAGQNKLKRSVNDAH